MSDLKATFLLFYIIIIIIIIIDILRKPECDEVGSELNANAAVEDVEHNADLYIAIQEDNIQN